jgi:histidinol-phosphate aminotransferase
MKIIPLSEEFVIPDINFNIQGKLLFIDSPNNPSGKLTSNENISKICEQFGGLVIIDEAYADFSSQSALKLLKKYKNLAVMRTFSKGYSLASQRIGFLTGHRDVIKILNKVKLPYNVPYLSQVAAMAAIKQMRTYKESNEKIIEERKRLTEEISKLNVEVIPSEANFLLVKMGSETAAMKIFWELQERKILLRHWNKKGLYQYLRVTIGKPEDNDLFLKAFTELTEKYSQ